MNTTSCGCAGVSPVMKGGGEYMPADGIDTQYTGIGEYMPIDGMDTQNTDIGGYIPVEGKNTQHIGGGEYLTQLANLVIPVSFLVAKTFLDKNKHDKEPEHMTQKGGDVKDMLTSLGSRIEGILNESNYLNTG